jgi:hypothetical protein
MFVVSRLFVQGVSGMKHVICFFVLVMLIGGTADTASAMTRNLGVQGGYSGDLDWFIGARAEADASRMFINARSSIDFNWFFPDQDSFNYFDFNLNYLWPMSALFKESESKLYVGLGLNVGRGWVSDVDDSDDWTIGMNLLGNFAYALGKHAMFVEGGYTFFSDYDQWRILTGFMF